jgi:hypothetical protein
MHPFRRRPVVNLRADAAFSKLYCEDSYPPRKKATASFSRAAVKRVKWSARSGVFAVVKAGVAQPFERSLAGLI